MSAASSVRSPFRFVTSPSADGSCQLADHDLVARIVGGDRDLFAALMQRYDLRLFRVVRSIVHPDAEAEDALQDAYLNAFSRLAGFEGRSSFSAWISSIAIRTALAQRCRADRVRALSADLATLGTHDREGAQDPQDEAAADDAYRLLESAIDALPVRYRNVVVLRLVEGRSTSETAGLLGTKKGVVRIRLLRGREKLRQVLAPRLG